MRFSKVALVDVSQLLGYLKNRCFKLFYWRSEHKETWEIQVQEAARLADKEIVRKLLVNKNVKITCHVY